MAYRYRTTRANTNSKQTRSYGPSRRSSGGGHKKKVSTIDPRRFVKVATKQEQTPYVPTHTFADFALPALIQQNITALDYATPSPIQDQAIPVGLAGKDIIGIAGTGTGKTAAFMLPILSRLLADRSARALIVAPTRELAQQIDAACRSFAKGSGLHGAVLIGGTGMGAQLRDLRTKPQIVIGTPGRIQDHVTRGTLDLSERNLVVLDEVDRMLDMGFINDVTKILKATAPVRQSFFFSATMSDTVRSLINTFTTEPHTVSIQASSASESVHQDIIRFREKSDKLDKLHDLLISTDVTKVIIFDETQRSVERLSESLQNRGFSAVSIHGGKSQGQRQRALAQFKDNTVTILVATDVAARGIDVADVTHVVNYATPVEYEDYIHRIGRAGRAGQIGYAYTFVPDNR